MNDKGPGSSRLPEGAPLLRDLRIALIAGDRVRERIELADASTIVAPGSSEADLMLVESSASR